MECVSISPCHAGGEALRALLPVGPQHSAGCDLAMSLARAFQVPAEGNAWAGVLLAWLLIAADKRGC